MILSVLPTQKSFGKVPEVKAGRCAAEPAVPRSLQLDVFCPGLMENWDVGVGVLPECEESLVCTFRLRLISRRREHSTELQVRQSADGIRPDDASMIENFLKLRRCFRIPPRGS